MDIEREIKALKDENAVLQSNIRFLEMSINRISKNAANIVDKSTINCDTFLLKNSENRIEVLEEGLKVRSKRIKIEGEVTPSV